MFVFDSLFHDELAINDEDVYGGEILVCLGFCVEDSFGGGMVVVSFLGRAVGTADDGRVLIGLREFTRVDSLFLLLILQAGRRRVRSGGRYCRRSPRRAAIETDDEDLGGCDW